MFAFFRNRHVDKLDKLLDRLEKIMDDFATKFAEVLDRVAINSADDPKQNADIERLTGLVGGLITQITADDTADADRSAAINQLQEAVLAFATKLAKSTPVDGGDTVAGGQ